MKRVVAIALVLAALTAGCSNAPEPGDLAAFCTLLESGTGLSASPTAADLERLALVAPPAVRPTIEALQSRARDFDDLLAMDPPDLEALFNARFDQQASSERSVLDTYAESSCGIVVDRPPATRWNNFELQNHQGASWAGLVTVQFDVASDRIETATIVFASAPEPASVIEDVCQAMSDFLVVDGADPGRIRVLVGTVLVLDSAGSTGLCRLP